MCEEEFYKKNSYLSLILIFANVVLILIYNNVGCAEDSQSVDNNFLFSVSLNIFFGLYSLSYNGRKYIIGKILFFLLLVINLFFYILLWVSSNSFHP